MTPGGIVALPEPVNFTRISDLPALAVAADGNVAFQDEHGSVELATPTGVSTIVNGEYVPRVFGSVGRGQLFALRFVGGDLDILAPIHRDFGSNGTAIFRRKSDGTVEALVSDLDAGPAALGKVIVEIDGRVNYPAPIANEQGDVVFAAFLGAFPSVGGVFTSLNAIDPKGPSISSVSVAKGRLVVTGANFKRGAKIVVGTTPYDDTKRNAKTPKTKLTSRTADESASTQEGIVVSVLNPDGR